MVESSRWIWRVDVLGNHESGGRLHRGTTRIEQNIMQPHTAWRWPVAVLIAARDLGRAVVASPHLLHSPPQSSLTQHELDFIDYLVEEAVKEWMAS